MLAEPTVQGGLNAEFPASNACDVLDPPPPPAGCRRCTVMAPRTIASTPLVPGDVREKQRPPATPSGHSAAHQQRAPYRWGVTREAPTLNVTGWQRRHAHLKTRAVITAAASTIAVRLR